MARLGAWRIRYRHTPKARDSRTDNRSRRLGLPLFRSRRFQYLIYLIVIPVTKNSQLRNYRNLLWANPLRRVYSPGALLVTAAATGPLGNSSAQPVYSPASQSQAGDPRANGSGYWNTSSASTAAFGNTYVGGSSFTLPQAAQAATQTAGDVWNSGLVLPVAVVLLVIFFIFRE